MQTHFAHPVTSMVFTIPSNPLLVLGVSITLIAAIAIVLRAVVIYFKGSPGGWNLLADFFATSPTPRGEIEKNQSIIAGRVPYRNCITVGIGDDGLYLAVTDPLSRPLFIPWTEFRIYEEVRFLGFRAILVSLRNPIVGTLTMPVSLFQKCRPHLPNLKRKCRRPAEQLLHWRKTGHSRSRSLQA